MSSKDFYHHLKPLDSFQIATDTRLHAHLPEDWTIILTDVIGSTAAIEKGRYKDVNTVGAATIMSIINVDRKTEIPYVFGGDGALLAIPTQMENGTRQALLASQTMAKDVFNLELRIAMIPVSEVTSMGLPLKVARYRQGPNITQTTLSGAGWDWAERAFKDPTSAHRFIVTAPSSEIPTADFTGLECRWEPVDAINDFKLCIIVKSTATTQSQQDQIYQEVFSKIEQIAFQRPNHHPLSPEKLKLSLNPFQLYHGVRAKNIGIISSGLSACWLALKSLVIGRYAVKHNLEIKGVKWGKYRDEMIDNADYRKFDGTLKMVLDVSIDQADLIEKSLEAEKKSGRIAYGISKSKKAIMTCLVFSDHQNHAHFVDGSDGGYAIAAKMLKSQISK